MRTKTSNAQIEVWEMKEAVFDKIKYLPKNKRIEYIFQDAQETINKLLVVRNSKFPEFQDSSYSF